MPARTRSARSDAGARPAAARPSHGTARGGTASAAAAVFCVAPKFWVGRNSVIVRHRAARYKLAPRAGGSRFARGCNVSAKKRRLKEAKGTLAHLQAENENHPDLADRASSETDRAIELRARDRQRKLIAKIDAALARLDDGTYGYCEETGEPISLKRLEARPIATLSVEAQERHERRERIYRDE